MAINWTADQTKAIDACGCNLLVSAAAGSGKTAVLVERIIRKILSGTDVDHLLVTTFTNAAAAKMRRQVGEAVAQKLAEMPQDTHLQRQMTLINRASICTIHSLCLDIVRANFHKLDIDPDFSMADPNEAELMKEQAAQETFLKLYEQREEWFLDLADTYGGRQGDEGLAELMLRLYAFVKSMPFPESWLAVKVGMFEACADFDGSEWAAAIKASALLTLDGCIAMTIDALGMTEKDEEILCYTSALLSDLSALKRLQSAVQHGWDNAVSALETFEFEKLKSARGVDAAKTEPVKKLRELVKEEIKSLKGKVFHTYAHDLCDDLRACAPRMRALGRLVLEFDETFTALKRQRGVLDFNDLEHLCLRVLSERDECGNAVPSEVALKLCSRYEELLVDEYQDSNELQETIFSMLWRGDNLFMVGDMKQSIYRFRHTNPLLFLHKQQTYSAEAGKNRKVIMSENFRSRSGIIDAVNVIFRQISSPLIGEMAYGPDEQLNAAADYPPLYEVAAGGMKIIIADKSSDGAQQTVADDTPGAGQPDNAGESFTGTEAEACHVAAEIRALMAHPFMVYEDGGYRPVTYRDIVILMRATAGSADVFARVLQERGVPVFADTGGGYFLTQEVTDILSLLEVIDNPLQDIPLLAVLRSPIAGFCDEALLQVRLCAPNGYVYHALESCAGGDGEYAEKCAKFLERLLCWRQWAHYMPTHELIWRLYTDTGYYGFAGAMSAGEQRQANLRLLYERARQYEKTSFRGLFHFISFIGRMRRASADFGSAKLLGENQDVVRIMSIHKSKGLEFPVVFVCGMGKRFNVRDMSEAVLLHKALGLGPDFKDNQARFSYPTVAKLAIRHKLKYENLSEELRLLYVALTRAKEKLIMTMNVKDAQSSLDKWRHIAETARGEKLAVHWMAGASCFADWVMPAALRSNRAVSGGNEADLPAPAAFEIQISPAVMAAGGVPENQPGRAVEASFKALVGERLAWRYPYEQSVIIPTKISVTELKRIHNFELDAQSAALHDIQMVSVPQFMQESKRLTAAQRGSVTHFVMQHLSLDAPPHEADIALQLEQMVAHELLTQQQAAAVTPAKIAAFFRTELGQRMCESIHVVREMPFEIEIAASEVYGEQYRDEVMLLQGMIDCYFEEDGKIILVDYKTDFVDAETRSIEKLTEQYRPQFEYYARALEKMTTKTVAEKNLYFFSADRVVKCV